MQRQLVLDTETTGGLEDNTHRIIEIGCVELSNRRFTHNNFHHYLNPERASAEEAFAIHGLTQEFLQNHPPFHTIVEAFIHYITGAQLIIHNAPFDLTFLNRELAIAGQFSNKDYGNILDYCTILDTLPLARQLHPGQRNNLDSLCKRYNINNNHRKLHGALVDAKLLAFVYLTMTGGQTTLFNEDSQAKLTHKNSLILNDHALRVIYATQEEQRAHQNYLHTLAEAAKDGCIWPENPPTSL